MHHNVKITIKYLAIQLRDNIRQTEFKNEKEILLTKEIQLISIFIIY